ncbi:MAG TPA: hypothetical protein VG892_05430 [Terriglobales bacterium]|nr:hypothetical protein [Terriglobales bacterium]
MSVRDLLKFSVRGFTAVGMLCFAMSAGNNAAAQTPAAGTPAAGAPAASQPAAPPTAKAQALIDVTGYWVSIINEDWRWRMITPAKGDFSSIPLTAEGRRVANSWDAAKDEKEGNQCRAYGAAGIMRLPARLHITWAEDNVLRMDIDAGKQTRLFNFAGAKAPKAAKGKSGELQWQGESAATWYKQVQRAGSARFSRGAIPGKGGSLKVITTRMRAGYLRKNGVPYSQNAVLTEYYDRYDRDGRSYLILTSVVDDPLYLDGTFITSEQFKREPDNSKWNPSPCRPLWPLALTVLPE